MDTPQADTPQFSDSRRLFGPSLWLDLPGVVLEGTAPSDAAATIASAWEHAVRRLASALGWPAPHVVAEHRGGDLMLAFTAPGDRLLTATEVNEWAWEDAVRRAGFVAPPALLSPGDLPRDEDGAIAQLAAMASAEVLAPTNDLAIVAHGDRHVALVTGSNGKTTTTRLIAAMMTAHGWRTGWCCTDGVFIAGEAVEVGDWSGPAGAQRVIADPAVQGAVLETARGGILRRGLGVLGVDVAVVTNIEADHFGEYGIRSLADLATVKLVAAKGLRLDGVLVLNADDATLRESALPTSHAAVWFSPSGTAVATVSHPVAAWRDGDRLLLDDPAGRHDLGDIRAMPLTVSGSADYNIANALAAALAASRLGVAPATIAQVLATFGGRPEDNAGRLGHYRFDGVEVFLDYAHNPTGLAGLLAVARSRAPERLLLLLGQAGNRGDDAIAALVRAAWDARPDRIIIKELEGYRRGREVGEVPALIHDELRRLGAPEEQLVTVLDEVDAVAEALRWARPGDLLVLPVHGLEARARVIELLEARITR
ncbi:MAG: Mur ligase family protein [Gemmatimonadales bacterium]